MNIDISSNRITKVLALVALCLTLTGTAVELIPYYSGHDNPFGLVRQFDLNGEANIPAWYSSFLLLLCSVLLAMIASAKKISGDKYGFHWQAMSIIFLFLAIDETAQIHEMITVQVRNSGFRPSGIFYYSWVIPYGIAFIIFVVSFLRFLVHLPIKTRWLFIIAAAIYVAGALGMEMVAGFHRTLYWNKDIIHKMMTVAEECLEMTGTVVFIHALTSYMSLYVKDVQIHFVGKPVELAMTASTLPRKEVLAQQ
jgi:hypothetical protein